jgi:type VI secretion system protein ImpK
MFLIENFQQFYGEVLRFKERIAEGTWVFEGDAVTAGKASIDTSPGAVWKRLHTILERQALDAKREGGDFGVELYRRAQYAMAALADEVFLTLDWHGRDAWRQNLLETRLFGTHGAGEEVFERIEALLRDRDSLYSELARVYLMVLALGFEGKYRGTPAAGGEVESVRRRLFQFIYGRDPAAVRGSGQLMPQAYQSTLSEGHPARLPYLRKWVWAIAMIVVLWVAGAHLLWVNETALIEPLVDRILQLAGSSRGSA